jgi:hypothetical protein
MLWRIELFLGKDSVNTDRGKKYAKIEDIRC